MFRWNHLCHSIYVTANNHLDTFLTLLLSQFFHTLFLIYPLLNIHTSHFTEKCYIIRNRLRDRPVILAVRLR